jgi:hypothetical protein
MGRSGRSPDSPLALAGVVAVGLAAGCNLIIGLDDVPVPADAGVAAANDTGAAAPADATTVDAVSAPTDAMAADVVPAQDVVSAQGHEQPLALVEDAGVSPLALAQDSTYLYWTEKNGTINRTAKSNGASTQLYDDMFSAPAAIAVDDGGVYWGDLLGVWMCPKENCSLSAVTVSGAVNFLQVESLAIDDVSVYWTEQTASVLTAPKDGQNQTGIPLWEGDATTENIATDGQRVYFTADDGLLHGVGVDGGSPFAVGSPSLSPSDGVVLDSDHVFWTVQDPYEGVVNGAPLDSLSPLPLASGLRSPGSIATDGTSLYWIATIADAGPAEGVYTCIIASCTPTLLAAGSPSLTSIVVDDTAVYWTDQGATLTTGAVYKLTK